MKSRNIISQKVVRQKVVAGYCLVMGSIVFGCNNGQNPCCIDGGDGGNTNCQRGETESSGCNCVEPFSWWNDIEMPNNPQDGIEPGQELIRVCSERMPDDFFIDFPIGWETESGSRVNIDYLVDEHKIISESFFTGGWTVRVDGISFVAGSKYYSRAIITKSRIEYYPFDRISGELYGDAVLVPLH